jgi:hypothetical protein
VIVCETVPGSSAAQSLRAQGYRVRQLDGPPGGSGNYLFTDSDAG